MEHSELQCFIHVQSSYVQDNVSDKVNLNRDFMLLIIWYITTGLFLASSTQSCWHLEICMIIISSCLMSRLESLKQLLILLMFAMIILGLIFLCMITHSAICFYYSLVLYFTRVADIIEAVIYCCIYDSM